MTTSFNVPQNSIFTWSLLFTDRDAEVQSISQAADAVVTTKTPHCFEVGNSVQLINVDSCPDRDGYYTVATVPDGTSFTAGIDSSQHGQTAEGGLAVRNVDLSLRSFGGEVYGKTTETLNLIQSATAGGQSGDSVLVFSSASQQRNIFQPGDIITVSDLGITNATVLAASDWSAINCFNETSTQTVSINQNVSISTSGVQDWSASRDRDGEYTVLSGTIGATKSQNQVVFTAPSLTRGTYQFKTWELIAGERKVLQEGTITYD
ncbi:MAG: hypothetical protein QNJ46_05865 [Leptolyngbyaceae cyanobacterium MO_188.B28]|nr:hypothetical protein [Leptolyngbyaceae cyanobacterium MO_188.B28]